MKALFIFCDQHNPQFSGCYGGITRTPNLDRLAKNGTRFKYAYSNNPVCAPSRACMFTGRYTYEHGFWDNATPYDGSIQNWVRHFKENGIPTTSVGKLDYTCDTDHGFHELLECKLRWNLDPSGFIRNPDNDPRRGAKTSFWQSTAKKDNSDASWDYDYKIAETAANWLNSDKAKSDSWILQVNFQKPHPKWRPRADLFDYYLEKVKTLSEKYRQPYEDLNRPEQIHSKFYLGYHGGEDEILRMHAAYHATVEETDELIGKVLDALEASGNADDTLIIYSSDHGEQCHAHGQLGKQSPYEDSTRVPLIVSGKGLKSGQVIETPVSLLEIYPTINEHFLLKHPHFARGMSLLPVCRGEKDAPLPDFVLSEMHSTPRYCGTYCIRKDEWKLIDYADETVEPLLFNLKEDPDEMRSLAKELPDKLYELQALLSSMLSKELTDKRAKREQRALIEEFDKTGQLEFELNKRGFAYNKERLIFVGKPENSMKMVFQNKERIISKKPSKED